ncbi:hypothetical protein Avbf_17287 [Armadillidium vulgare]|nr:hypothetical protein Avbf_17287 [Armadillidium vulgare]
MSRIRRLLSLKTIPISFDIVITSLFFVCRCIENITLFCDNIEHIL